MRLPQAQIAVLYSIHLICPLHESQRDTQAEGLGRLEVDHQLGVLVGLNRQAGLAPLRILST